ncbi:amidase [Mesorhizobium sp. KR9-304]|uniref:amidase n=1 Tax=Mesorhizobium sp. KR9-304 TaxID=3156614 RepID=UPI0032B5EA32
MTAPVLTTRDRLNAFLDHPEVAVDSATAGPLAGLTLGVKDIFDVAGYVSGWGNPDRFAEAKPAVATAPAVQKLLDAGARFIGKTQTEELAFSMIGQNVHFPRPVNPAAPDRVTGGSSSGSAAAVAGGLADIGTGSDTGGSVRAPASFCGLMGLRTTHGLISLEGTMPLAPSFDTFGWFARDAEIYERVGEVLLGGRIEAAEKPRLISLPALDELVSGPAEATAYGRMKRTAEGVLGPVHAAKQPPFSIDELYWATRKLQAREAWAAHGEWISVEGRRIGQAIHDRFAFGKTVSAADVAAETKKRDAFRAAFANLLGNDGILVLPTVPCAAPKAASTAEELGAFRERAIRLLCWSGLSGFPQISLPLGQVDSAPFGISLLGPAGSDLALIRLGRRVLESAGRG